MNEVHLTRRQRLRRTWRHSSPTRGTCPSSCGPHGVQHQTTPCRRFPHGHGVSAGDRLGPDGVAQLVADHQLATPPSGSGRTYGLSEGAILRLLDLSGVPRRTRALAAEQVQEAVQLYGGGWSLTGIGDHFGKDHTVVRNARLRAGITLRRALQQRKNPVVSIGAKLRDDFALY